MRVARIAPVLVLVILSALGATVGRFSINGVMVDAARHTGRGRAEMNGHKDRGPGVDRPARD